MTKQELNDAFHDYMDQLPDLMMEETNDFPDGVFPDGRYYDWDEELREVVETAPDKRRYVVKFQNGELARVRELVPACND